MIYVRNFYNPAGFTPWMNYERGGEMIDSRNLSFGGSESLFATTHWSVVSRSQAPGTLQSEDALARLCQSYWYPLYCFIRRQGHSAHDAQDLVQGFFGKVIEKNYFKGAKQEKGRLRSFLLLALKRYMANEWDRANRQKRGGGQEVISLDLDETESRYQIEPIDQLSPEKIFDRQWAITLLDQVLSQLESECSEAGTQRVFRELKVFLTGEKSEHPYSVIAARLGIAEGTLRGTVFRLRQRYREILLSRTAQTVDSPPAIEDELRDLFAAFN